MMAKPCSRVTLCNPTNDLVFCRHEAQEDDGVPFTENMPLTLQDLQPDATVRGNLPDALVTVVSIAWHGSDALTLVYRAPNGRVADEILYRHDEPRLKIVEAGRSPTMDWYKAGRKSCGSPARAGSPVPNKRRCSDEA